eukprot:scaffold97414_cov65-Phaeocystis_antarctica.AAC.1
MRVSALFLSSGELSQASTAISKSCTYDRFARRTRLMSLEGRGTPSARASGAEKFGGVGSGRPGSYLLNLFILTRGTTTSGSVRPLEISLIPLQRAWQLSGPALCSKAVYTLYSQLGLNMVIIWTRMALGGVPQHSCAPSYFLDTIVARST